jgi:hypothetical protein
LAIIHIFWGEIGQYDQNAGYFTLMNLANDTGHLGPELLSMLNPDMIRNKPSEAHFCLL